MTTWIAVPILTTPCAPHGLEGGLVDEVGVGHLGAQAGDAAFDFFDVLDTAEPGDDLLSLGGHAFLPEFYEERVSAAVTSFVRFVTVAHGWPIYASTSLPSAE